MLMATVSVHGANFLCVGLNEYEDYGNLRFAEKDAAEIAGLLSEQGHDVSLLVGENVTRENVINALQDESTIVYFAGHGEKGYMVLADGQMALKEIADRCAVLLLDCCYAGNSVQDDGGTRILAAAQHEAFEGKDHGLFSKYLLRWLKKGLELSDERMIKYVSRGIARETGGWQKPVFGYI